MSLRARSRGLPRYRAKERKSGRSWIPPIIALSLSMVEAAVAVHFGRETLAIGLSEGPAAGVFTLIPYASIVHSLAKSAFYIEVAKGIMVIAVLTGVSLLAGRERIEKSATFLWVTGIYIYGSYAGRFLLSGWPDSLTARDVIMAYPRSIVLPIFVPLGIALVMLCVSGLLFLKVRSRRVGRLTF